MLCQLLLFTFAAASWVTAQDLYGPDPWHREPRADIYPQAHDRALSESVKSNNDCQKLDAFYKRLVIVILRSGQTESYDDGSVGVTLKMKYSVENIKVLEDIAFSKSILTDEKLRRVDGYISESIYVPTLTETISRTFSTYVLDSLRHYKNEITYICMAAAFIITGYILSKYVSKKFIWILFFIIIFCWEAIVSYKEVEKKTYDEFMRAIEQCGWSFWKSSCDMPIPDTTIFWKHLHPLKIIMRLTTLLISEPLLSLSGTVGEICDKLTENLPFGIRNIVNGILFVFMIVILICLVISISCNYILNIPINLSMFWSLVSFNLAQRSNKDRLGYRNRETNSPERRIRGENLNPIRGRNDQENNQEIPRRRRPQIKQGSQQRSLSAGRLPIARNGSGDW